MKNQTNTHTQTNNLFPKKKERDYLHFKLRYKHDAEVSIYFQILI